MPVLWHRRRTFAAWDNAKDSLEPRVLIKGRYEGNQLVIYEVIATVETKAKDQDIPMRLIPGTDPARYERA